MNNKKNNDTLIFIVKILTIGLIFLGLLTVNGLVLLLNQTIEYECNSGDIKMDLLINDTNFSHFRLTEINGLTCKGKIPVYLLNDFK